MKNPLTSKERRGLVAVAAAALLCVSMGFVFRNCSPRHVPAASFRVNDSVRSEGFERSERSEESEKLKKPEKGGRKSDKDGRRSGSRKGKKKAPERVYPVREPLDQPID